MQDVSIVETADLLDLELSHDADDDVSKPVQNDGSTLFDYEEVDVTEPMLGNNIDSAQGTSINIRNDGENNSAKDDAASSNVSCFNIEYYQPYFDIDTSEELDRLRKALLPFTAGEFFDKDLDEQPDLYGPFWIITTLAFLMAAMGNFAAYINTNEESVGEWNGDITRISEAATFLYTGSAIVPILLYIILRTYEVKKGLVELVSLYGYSLMSFIIACILCIAPWNFLDWTVVLCAMCASILFLIKNIYKPLSDDKKSKPGFYVLVIICGCQFILALALKLYFFKY